MKASRNLSKVTQTREFVAVAIGLGVIALSPVLTLSLLCDVPALSLGITLAIIALSAVAYFVAPKEEDVDKMKTNN